jgi:hypothetical protein
MVYLISRGENARTTWAERGYTDLEIVDVVRPILVMGGAVSLVMLGRELHRGWLETAALKRIGRRKGKGQGPGEDDKDRKDYP